MPRAFDCAWGERWGPKTVEGHLEKSFGQGLSKLSESCVMLIKFALWQSKWHWKIPHLSLVFPLKKSHFCCGLPTATFRAPPASHRAAWPLQSPPRGQKSRCGPGIIWRLWVGWLPSGKHTKSYGKSPFFMGQLTISMAIFNSYVKLPEGTVPLRNFLLDCWLILTQLSFWQFFENPSCFS